MGIGVVRQDVNRSAGSSGLSGRVSDAEVGQRTMTSWTLLIASSDSSVALGLMVDEDACKLKEETLLVLSTCGIDDVCCEMSKPLLSFLCNLD